ncbi:MAG: trans-aconitate 2-methyltransferase [Acidimicrobiia bacterium]|nr:trans-aconitate 2-methyltransferase [Acidimicrobiia bacterium]
MWDPATYLTFEDERSRPFVDLLSRVGAKAPADVVDLGSGPGQLTATLAARWPSAQVLGVDSSAEMLASAAPLTEPGRLAFAEGDAATWEPPGPVDVLVSNATLQWVPGHRALLTRYVSWLRPEGWLAIQVPGNFDAPSHALVRELTESPRWAGALSGAAGRTSPVAGPADYAEDLAALHCRVDAWETTYLHVLAGEDAVLGWVRGTALRPVLARLGPAEQEDFLAELAPRLRGAYPPRPHGTPFPFRRVFVVAQRQAA